MIGYTCNGPLCSVVGRIALPLSPFGSLTRDESPRRQAGCLVSSAIPLGFLCPRPVVATPAYLIRDTRGCNQIAGRCLTAEFGVPIGALTEGTRLAITCLGSSAKLAGPVRSW